MPSLLVLAGIMEKNGGYGGDLAGSGFGSEGLLVPPDEEEDDSRALRVALGQLSLLGLGEAEDGGGAPTTGTLDRSNNNNNHHHNNHTNSVGGGGETGLLPGKSKLCVLYDGSSTETKGRGCNITECVPVPSSEHVAEIVGRQGCKIKALRAKTNTYIKTTGAGGSPPAPLPGPDHHPGAGAVPGGGAGGGAKGSTIKRIQQQTCTYIVTPSRDRDPVFRDHPARPATPNAPARRSRPTSPSARAACTTSTTRTTAWGPEVGNGGLESRLQQVWGPQGGQRKPLTAATGRTFRTPWSAAEMEEAEGSTARADFPNPGEKPCSYFGSEGTQCWGDPDYPKQVAFYAQQRSKSFGGLPLPLSRLSPGLVEPRGTAGSAGSPHSQARRAHSEPISASAAFSGRLPVPDSPPAAIRDCMTCFESKVTAALVPCGHNLFCMECAIRICELNHPECPVCHTLVTQAIRIFS
ncbi:hypothetical protein SKAU_G00221650 [Synaphobranchus kaupii]|uniref:RING-type domain-containing protein n=1 Tax=Synaphobranchus kaupii TaxID=118154 RepID=A0A9Q1FBC8_SYNKA|nr:hypothetical protein SKAU_G00221650 [Synaphobranchus kaupii]